MPEEYPGSERHFEVQAAPAPRMTKEERVDAIRQAAVQFANDCGPLPAANEGSEAAMHEVASRMVRALRRRGLTIIQL